MPHPDDLAAKGLSPTGIQAQLARILHSPTFAHAPTLRRLLQHLVGHALEGTANQLKEYSLGVDVFDRGETFDPRIDTIVRVQARRLRAKLNDYYGSHGRFDPVVIAVPTGRYTATFSTRPVAHTRESRHVVPLAHHERGVRPLASESIRHSLPVPRTPLIGRGRELNEVKALLREPAVRLLTLTGTGGSGKTRLAVQAATDVVDDFPGGVLLFSLAPLTTAASVTTGLAQLMGLRHAGGRPLDEALVAYVKHVVAAPTLLLLDNFEHILDAATSVVGLLEASACLKVLVTSRAVLHVYGEHEFPVLPLDVPGPECGLPELERNPAVALFVQRARSASPSFELRDSNAPVIAELCRRLDGLPLAIELAAARVKLFAVESMLPRLEQSLDFLAGGPRDVPARQQTLRKTVDWSHELLTGPEQRLFRRAAVLVGGFTLESAEAVCNPGRDLGVDVVTGVASLLDKNLVHQLGIGGEARFNMLEILRKYALERLSPGSDDVSTRRAHAAYCIVVAEEGGLPRTAAEREAWLRRCDAEQDNLRSALDWLVLSRNVDWALRLGVALYRYWEFRELLEEGRQRLQTVVNLASDTKPTVTWARAVGCAANLCHTQGDWESAQMLHRRALDAFRSLRDRRGEAAQLNALGCGYRFGGDYTEARAHGEAALELCRELGDRAELAGALSNLAGVLSLQGHRDEARAMLDQARRIFERLDDQLLVTWSLNHLGDVARHGADLVGARRLYQASLDGFARLGDPGGIARASADLAYVSGALQDFRAARRMYAQALTIFGALDHKRGVARVFEGFAVLARQQQQFGRALAMAGAAAALRAACGSAPRPAEQATLDESLARAWQSLERADAQAAWETGRRMSLDEAIRFALAD